MSPSKLFSSSSRYEATRLLRQLLEWRSYIYFWKWEVNTEPVDADSIHSLRYIGRRQNKNQLKLVIGLWSKDKRETGAQHGQPKGQLRVSELPFSGAICVPHYLSHVLPLDRPIEKLLENIDRDKLKFFLKQRSQYRLEPVSAQDAAQVDQTMLRPFATYRYGEWAQQIDLAKVQKMARVPGGLTAVYQAGDKVSCFLGSEISRRGQRYWRGERSGFAEAVYTHSKTFNQVNSMTYFLEIEWACAQGYAFYEYGVSLARPEDGVLQWKRKMRGHLDTMGNYNCFYVAPPKALVSTFFWEFPLFGLEQGRICLHLGWPADKSEEDFANRYSSMGFGGLSTVYLHCKRPPSEQLLASVANLFVHFKQPPNIQARVEATPA